MKRAKKERAPREWQAKITAAKNQGGGRQAGEKNKATKKRQKKKNEAPALAARGAECV